VWTRAEGAGLHLPSQTEPPLSLQGTRSYRERVVHREEYRRKGSLTREQTSRQAGEQLGDNPKKLRQKRRLKHRKTRMTVKRVSERPWRKRVDGEMGGWVEWWSESMRAVSRQGLTKRDHMRERSTRLTTRHAPTRHDSNGSTTTDGERVYCSGGGGG
jgi:hypothetical protein